MRDVRRLSMAKANFRYFHVWDWPLRVLHWTWVLCICLLYTSGVLLRFSAMFNGFDEMAMTNLDGYDKCPEIKICTGYDLDGEILA